MPLVLPSHVPFYPRSPTRSPTLPPQIGVRVDVPKLYIPEYRSAIWAGKLKPSLAGLSRHLLEHYNQRMYADVEIVSRDGEVFFAHRIIVAGESGYLREYFEHSEQNAEAAPMDGSLMRVSLPHINYRTLEAVLRLMYGYELSLDYNTLFEVRGRGGGGGGMVSGPQRVGLCITQILSVMIFFFLETLAL